MSAARFATTPTPATQTTISTTPTPHTPPMQSHRKQVETLPRHLEAAQGDIWRARCLALAESGNLLYRSSWLTKHDLIGSPLGATEDGVERFAVPSMSRPDETHLVEYEPATETVRCVRRATDPADMICAGHFERPCGHVGSVLHWLSQVETVLRAARDQLSQLAERADEDRWALIDKGRW